MPPRPLTVSWKQVKNLVPQMVVALDKMKDAEATVGVHADAGKYDAEPGKEPVPVANVALWLEYGTQFMPARPFMGPTVMAKQQQLQAMMGRALAEVSELRVRPNVALRKLAFTLQVWIQNAMKLNQPPPLSAAYLRRRKLLFPEAGSRTLVASSLLLRSVRYVLRFAGKVVKEHAGPAAPNAPQPQTRDDARKAAAVDKAYRASQRAAAKANPGKAKREFDKQRRIPLDDGKGH